MDRLNKLLLSELRIIQRLDESKNDNVGVDLESAIVDNENLKALGYQLKENDIIKLAKDYGNNSNFTPLYKRLQILEPEVKVSPMYPGFPIEVLNMDELSFRVDQLKHYLTTYGLERALGIEVNKGVLPYDKRGDQFKERLSDKQVADLKSLDYLSPQEVDNKVISDLIGRKERLTSRELELSQEVVFRTNQPIENIPFKENIGLIFGDILLKGTLEERQLVLSMLSNIVEHPGDVLDIVEQLVILNKYKHFKTSLKRGMVNLIEQFPSKAIEENLASNRWSRTFLGKGGTSRAVNRNIALIDYLSYTRFSTNKEAIRIVNEMKDGKLLSWNQLLEKKYMKKDYNKVLNMLYDRPGIYFRQLNRLVNLGIDDLRLIYDMKELAGRLKTQSIVSTINNFEGDDSVRGIFLSTLYANLSSKNVDELRDKTIYIDEGDVIFAKSRLEITDKSEEGGYISNGMAIKIPDESRFLRFFTYWNDDDRIDIDLHGVAADDLGQLTHVGWNGEFREAGLVHSGDITHSNAAEYIDLDLEAAEKQGLTTVQFNINSYTGVPFSDIDTVFTGLMVLSELGQEVDLHDPKNVIFRHDLESRAMGLDYGMIDLVNKVIYVGGSTHDNHNDTNIFDIPNYNLTIEVFLRMLVVSQGSRIVNNRQEADVILGLAKSDEKNYFSLIDKNFFM